MSTPYTLITGGAGFVGANLADRLLSQGENVVIYDNLSRAGVEQNFQWLRDTHGEAVRLIEGDIREAEAVAEAVQGASSIFHFAAQVAVTTSLEDPRRDFEINALGTLNLLEAIRALPKRPPLVFTSTNKVYGSLSEVALRENADRHEPLDAGLRTSGIPETQPLEFYSPYGCSKGTADQYVLDHARIFGLPAVVFRMSCIYGPHQFGTEDQGWVAHFLIQGMEGRPLTIYGDGKQVRDVLFVEDLVEAFLLARSQADELKGQAFNIGGGAGNTISLLELMALMGELDGTPPAVEWSDWRPGDQLYYVSDTSKFQRRPAGRRKWGWPMGSAGSTLAAGSARSQSAGSGRLMRHEDCLLRLQPSLGLLEWRGDLLPWPHSRPARRGHQVTFYEPDAFDRQQHRDLEPPSWLR